MAGRVIDAALTLLDRQILDKDGRMAGNVDDLELEFGPEGGAPYVKNILLGPGAWGPRLRGRIGRWVTATHERLHHVESPDPARISFGVVKKITNHIELTVSKYDLPINLFRDWVSDNIIKRIPGAEHATE